MGAIQAVIIHPPIAMAYRSGEHPEGQLDYIGDARGVDVVPAEWVDGWMRDYRNDGANNEDWYGWNQPVLAPFDSTVVSVRVNDVVNKPGTLGKPPASSITFQRRDGVHVVLAHVQAIEVAEGDKVKAGQHVARVGNNGMAWMPHVHIGAWKGDTPLQVRFDLKAMGKLQGFDQPQ